MTTSLKKLKVYIHTELVTVVGQMTYERTQLMTIQLRLKLIRYEGLNGEHYQQNTVNKSDIIQF